MTDFLPPDEEVLFRYLDNELSQKEREDVERRAATDPSFAERLQSLQLAAHAVKLYGIKEKVASVHGAMMQELQPSKKAKVVSMAPLLRKAVVVAAVFLLLFVGVAGYQYYRLNADRLYEEAYVPYTVSVTRGEERAVITPVAEAYQRNAFTEVVRLARSGAGRNGRDSLLAGIALLQLNEEADAVTWLEKAGQGGAEDVRQDSDFYRALALLKGKQYEAALQLMQQIREDAQHPYREQFSASFIRKVTWLDWKE